MLGLGSWGRNGDVVCQSLDSSSQSFDSSVHCLELLMTFRNLCCHFGQRCGERLLIGCQLLNFLGTFRSLLLKLLDLLGRDILIFVGG